MPLACLLLLVWLAFACSAVGVTPTFTRNPVDTPASEVELSDQAATPQPTYLALQSPDQQFTLHLLDASSLRERPALDAIQNLGYRLSASVPAVFAVVEIIGGEQIVLELAPSIHLPPGVRPGDRLRIFAATSDGGATLAAEFTLSPEGNLALDLHQAAAPPELLVALPTPTPPVIEAETYSPSRDRPELTLSLERLYVSPEQPLQGQPFTITAIIRNQGDVDVRVPVWISAHRDGYTASMANSNSGTAIIPAGAEIELTWGGTDVWQSHELIDLSWDNAYLIFRAGVNVASPGGLHNNLLPESDKRDNSAQIRVDFLPYQPRASDACPPGDNLWIELGQPRTSQAAHRQPALPVIVHNDGHIEAVRVAVRISDVDGRRFLTHVRSVPPCGGAASVDIGPFVTQFTHPLTYTLNPPDVPGALTESDRSDNVIVASLDKICTGQTDLWLKTDDVAFEGDDLLVTVHLAGSSPPQGLWVRVYHTDDGRVIANKKVRSDLPSCREPKTIRLAGALAGLPGGAIMVRIYAEPFRIEFAQPQYNNAVTVLLP